MMKDSDRSYRPRGTDSPPCVTPSTKAANRLERFTELNKQISGWGGWITSHVGVDDVRVECLPDSIVPAKLEQELGYTLTPLPDGERIVCGAIVEVIEEGTANRPQPVARYDGPTRVERYKFRFHD